MYGNVDLNVQCVTASNVFILEPKLPLAVRPVLHMDFQKTLSTSQKNCYWPSFKILCAKLQQAEKQPSPKRCFNKARKTCQITKILISVSHS